MNNISKKKWVSLSINSNNKEDINFLYLNFHNDILGTFENNDDLIFYFDYKIKDRIDCLENNNFSINDIKYDNWHKGYEQYFKPIKIDNQITVIPDWHSTKIESIDYIKIKPGMAFGTGTHETTQLILFQLKNYISKGNHILDLGSGSGILAIGALKYGASSVTCYEYDKDCEENFFENMQLNHISDNYKLSFDNVLSIKNFNYDCILANINKNVIMDLLPNIKKHRLNKSKIILSGLLISDKKEVINLINKLKFKLIDIIIKGEWICLIIE